MKPRVEFSFGHVTWDTYVIESFLKEKREKETEELRKYLLEVYPNLKKIKIRKDIKKFILDEYKKNFNNIYEKILHFQEEWDKINDKVLKAISDVIETKWDRDVVDAYVSINPICPRDWKDYEFSISFRKNDKRFMETCVHEIVHFIYFKKVKEIFPNINTKTFDYGKRWVLSEILAPIIMNDPRIVKIIGESDLRSYACDEKTTKKFWKLYQERLKKKESFEKFYKKCEKIFI